MMKTGALLVSLLMMSGCVAHVRERCSTCVVLDVAHPRLPPLKPNTRTLYVIVPGVLGYGWEWDAAVHALERAPETDFVVFWWNPWGSLYKASHELATVLAGALALAPKSVTQVVVVGHSVGGMVAAYAVGGLRVPDGRHVKVVTIGAPFAGMMGPPFSLDDPIRSPAMMAVMGTFREYPPPPPGVEVVSYVTSYPSDPVMQPRYGHQVAPPDIGPRGARRIAVDPKMDHNKFVSQVVIDLLKEKPWTSSR
jgi:alpha-beta hydrolase superfamily lysophospholipase